MNRIKAKRIIKWGIIGVAVMCLTLFVGFIALFYFIFIGGPAKVTRDVNDYASIFTEECIETGYIVFPETIPDSATDIDFYHSYRLGIFDPTVETYLRCTYDTETYQREIDRLENTGKTYGDKRKILLKDEKKKFNFPAYIAIENAGNGYEYALLTGDNEITYIYTCYIEKEHVHFDESYLPSDFMTEEGRAFGSGYSIYYAVVTDSMIDTDYSREPVYAVTDGHLRFVNDNSFCVRTVLNENGEEVITGCYFTESTSLTDEGTETEYTELNGYIYQSLELNRDRTQAIVTYLKDETTETYTFDL